MNICINEIKTIVNSIKCLSLRCVVQEELKEKKMMFSKTFLCLMFAFNAPSPDLVKEK